MVSARERTFLCRPEQALSALHLLVCWAQHLSLQSLHWSTGHTAHTARGSCCCLFWLEILQPRRQEKSHVSIIRAAAIPLINRQGVSSQGTRPRAGTGGRAGYKYFASCKSRVAGKHESVSLLNLAHLSGTTFPRCRPHRSATVLRPCPPANAGSSVAHPEAYPNSSVAWTSFRKQMVSGLPATWSVHSSITSIGYLS